ncbi:MAG: class I SAM-dependent methyltransferase [Flavicella sp.]
MTEDIYGTALLDYQQGNYSEDIITYVNVGGEEEKDVLPLPYLFRTYNEMPSLEKKALSLCKGTILDIGAGAGSHSLHLQEKGKEVTALDISKGAFEVCKARGIKNCLHGNVLDLKHQKFDTILALMNGAGMCGKLKTLAPFLKHLKTLLKSKGQILLDSSDIIYMYEDEEGDHWIPSDLPYYGEVIFKVAYKNKEEKPFPWMYIDFNTLQRCAHDNGFDCKLIQEGAHYDYLAQLTLREQPKD